MTRIFAILLLILCHPSAKAQQDTTRNARPVISFLGFADAFYAYDSHRPEPESRQPFLYNHNRHGQFNVNLALVRADIRHQRFRGAVAFHAGTYVDDNYSEESSVVRHIAEAHAGVSFGRSGRLWLDVGIMPSHIGFESAISSENPTLTRSLAAENSPYFLAAAKLTYQVSDRLEAAVLVCNGWQRIRPVAGNTLPGFGTQVVFSPSGKISLNWSTFIGTEDPDSTRRMRFFNNLYADISLGEHVRLITGFDIGMQQQSKGSSRQHLWWTPVLIAHWQWHQRWATALRGEYYEDANGANIAPMATGGFRAGGASLTMSYSPHPMVMCRVECRWLNSPDSAFEGRGGSAANAVTAIGSLALRFSR